MKISDVYTDGFSIVVETTHDKNIVEEMSKNMIEIQPLGKGFFDFKVKRISHPVEVIKINEIVD